MKRKKDHGGVDPYAKDDEFPINSRCNSLAKIRIYQNQTSKSEKNIKCHPQVKNSHDILNLLTAIIPNAIQSANALI